MDYQTIQINLTEAVARITLHRPDKMNSFNAQMHGELKHALGVVSDRGARVLVLTGAGRGFCAGQDLSDDEVRFTPGEPPPDLGAVVERHYKPLIEQLNALPMPTIAAVNGVAAGAGAALALACDMVVATRSAFFMLPFAKIGLIPDTGCSWVVPQRIGQARALGLAFTGQKLPSDKAAEWGLIWESVPDDSFAASVDALAAQLATMPTRALVATRHAMRLGRNHTLTDHLSHEARLMSELGRSADYVEGVAAFLQKRPAQFTGK